MVATKITPTVRFPGLANCTWYYVPTIASISAPSRAELDAGKDLTDEVMDWDGWSIDTDLIDAPDVGTGFVAKLNGRRNPAESSLVIYMSSDTTDTQDVRLLFEEGDTGYIVRFDSGDVEDAYMDVWPVAVRSLQKAGKADDPSTVTVNFRITSEPAQNVVVPAESSS